MRLVISKILNRLLDRLGWTNIDGCIRNEGCEILWRNSIDKWVCITNENFGSLCLKSYEFVFSVNAYGSKVSTIWCMKSSCMVVEFTVDVKISKVEDQLCSTWVQSEKEDFVKNGLWISYEGKEKRQMISYERVEFSYVLKKSAKVLNLAHEFSAVWHILKTS